MNILYNEMQKVFKIDTCNTSYIMAVVDGKYLGHVYYGQRIEDENVSYLMRTGENPYVPSKNRRDKLCFLDTFPMEYPTHGIGDFREDAIAVKTVGGQVALELFVESYEIVDGKPGLVQQADKISKRDMIIPALFQSACGSGKTLRINLIDEVLNLKVVLSYSVFEDSDAIVRSAKVINLGEEEIYLTKCMSASFDMDDQDYELLTLNGSWARERHIQRKRIGYGFQGVSSLRGETSHQHQAFMALLSSNATQETGDVYTMHLVYSGNFKGIVYKGQFDNVRMMMGINDEDFSWRLDKDMSFQAPEVVLTYSHAGLGQMSRCHHDLYRNHLIRSPFKDKERPILINNWEATYFNFDTEKLVDIAKEAANHGIEMLVMDDGWFGERCDDNRALGDWFVNEDKIKGGLKYLVDQVNYAGLKFGIWFEPEMISPNSDLYRSHPDWAIAIPGREPGLCRCQYVLDISRYEVRGYIVDRLSDILASANIEYVKWDMNRQLSDMYSLDLPADRQGELYHRYVLALYDMQDRILRRFPGLLLENCSGGGARFDPGMLYFSPQIWCSDDTDAIERLYIQEGTALIYPLSSMGAHVSDCPNHVVGRNTPFETRGYVALAGTFGYELDITRISEDDRSLIANQCSMYHTYHDIFAKGDYYRLASYSENHGYDAYMSVSKDKTEALLTFIQVLGRPNVHSRRLRLSGLDEEKKYKIYKYNLVENSEEEYMEEILSGGALMKAGINIGGLYGDYKGLLLIIRELES